MVLFRGRIIDQNQGALRRLSETGLFYGKRGIEVIPPVFCYTRDVIVYIC